MPETAICLVDGREHAVIDGMFLRDLNAKLRGHIRSDYPQANNQSFICRDDLLKYRLDNVDRMISSDLKQTKRMNVKLTKRLNDSAYQIVDVNDSLEKSLTTGERVSDAVARFGGSWTFIFIFAGILLVWMIVNGLHLFGVNFDAYPFILLNLFLSTVAALQAPIIMMSQNRSADRDRMDAENDYHVTLLSEEEIRLLHSKTDHLIQNEWPHLLEIQKTQMEMLAELHQEVAELRQQQAVTAATKDANEKK